MFGRGLQQPLQPAAQIGSAPDIWLRMRVGAKQRENRRLLRHLGQGSLGIARIEGHLLHRSGRRPPQSAASFLRVFRHSLRFHQNNR